MYINVDRARSNIENLQRQLETVKKSVKEEILIDFLDQIADENRLRVSIEDIEEIRLPNNFVTEMMFLQNLPERTELDSYEQISLGQYEESIVKIRESGIRITITV